MIAADSLLALPMKSQTVALAADNTAITVTDATLLLLSSNSTTYTARTFTLVASATVGHQLTIVFTAGSSNTAQLVVDATTILRGDWVPTQYDILQLVSDGTRWLEVARNQYQGLNNSAVALAADNQVVATSGVDVVTLTSDSTTYTARTFTLTPSTVVGHKLMLVFTSAAANTAQLIVDATTILRGDWIPTQYDTLFLQSDGTRWIELARNQYQGLKTSSVTLIADNTAVATVGVDVLLLGSDDTTAANRTFTLTASTVVGHELKIVFTTAASTTAQLADTGIQKLSAAWEPVQYGTLTLVSDGTNWIETGRAAN
jgi:hypothetical protein